MAGGCGNCNYHGDVKFPNDYLCLLTQKWTYGGSCEYYLKYTNMSDDRRTTLAIEKKRQIDEEKRRIEEDSKEKANEMKRNQERKEERRFKLKTLILSNLASIIVFIFCFLIITRGWIEMLFLAIVAGILVMAENYIVRKVILRHSLKDAFLYQKLYSKGIIGIKYTTF